MDTAYLLELRGITKQFPGVKALDNVSFGVLPGEVHAILGENGAGKSTLMNIIFGYYQASAGELIWKGKEILIDNSLEAKQIGIAMVHQEGSLLQDMDVTSNIFLGNYDSCAGFVLSHTLRTKALAVMEELGIDYINPDKKVRNLSAADQKMVEITKAIASNPKLLLLDEPSASLTEHEIATLFEVINKLKKRGVAVLYISHRLEEIFEIGDRVTILRDGKHVVTGAINEFTMDSIIFNMVGHSLSSQLEELQENRRNFSSEEEILSVNNLCKNNKFSNITFSAYKGEIVGISGLVGAGRTELLEAIFGYNPADSGIIKINNQSVKIRNCEEAMQHGLVMIPEDRAKIGIFGIQSVKFNIVIATIKAHKKRLLLSDSSITAAAQKSKEQLNIRTPSLDKLIKELSGGNQQKCIVARVLYTHPKILLLDEPTHGIDVGTKAEIYRIIRQLADEGMTVLFVSSELNELLIMADRIMVMHEGRQMGILDRKEFSQERIIAMASGIV